MHFLFFSNCGEISVLGWEDLKNAALEQCHDEKQESRSTDLLVNFVASHCNKGQSAFFFDEFDNEDVISKEVKKNFGLTICSSQKATCFRLWNITSPLQWKKW